MANVRLLGRADVDLEEARAYYAARSLRAAHTFEDAVSAALARLAAMPEIYALTDDRHRLCPIKKSQYLIVYRFDQAANEVVVVAVPHAKQNPTSWQPSP
jgi:plasmid stabilization system protein ParE